MEKLKVSEYVNLFDIPIDLYKNICNNIACKPDDWLKEYDELLYNDELIKYETLKNGTIFCNIIADWDSCDCGDGYGCSHGSWIYQLRVLTETDVHTIEIEDEDCLYVETLKIPLKATIGDFYRACQLCDIQLEFTDYGKSLLTMEENLENKK